MSSFPDEKKNLEGKHKLSQDKAKGATWANARLLFRGEFLEAVLGNGKGSHCFIWLWKNDFSVCGKGGWHPQDES